MQELKAVFKRELYGYFETPVAFVVIVVFLMMNGIFTFYMGNFYEQNHADLEAFFNWHAWLYLFLIPAITMRLWSEEQRVGTLELLMTLPITPLQAVLAKFFAAWVFATIALFLTFPIWITVNYLGDPDNGKIISGYLGSMILASGYLAIGSGISAMTRNQVVAFVITVTVCFIMVVSGYPLILDFFVALGMPQALLDVISSFSFITHSSQMTRGVIGLHNIVFFGSLAGLWLYITVIALQLKRG